MENRTQPILCCIGDDVAGEPTQFLMERVAAAGQLDWHAITVEVSPDKLAEAWRGIDVMQFRAARFFSAHQASAMHLVAEPSAQDLFVGGVTSALRVSGQWQMWHNSGPSLIELFSRRFDWSKSLCWVKGESMRTRSFLAACQATPPKQVYWTVANIPDADQTPNDSASSDFQTELAKQIPLCIESPASSESKLVDELANESNGFSAVVLVGEHLPQDVELILNHQPVYECTFAANNSAPGLRRKLNEVWRAGEVVVLSLADLIVAEEAFDQIRWTGQPANWELLREAYEEYADF